ncbi:unnamed protein product [Symbiodinium necroappetens]|uniref:alpha-L-rhamnosidase n=1 Tax=Symbiodinium necroappetens TaxID=1628268 RepID=A0A813A9K8_9DINO|nr:unnamed protein product [Symbiodinium necroappetens]
MANMWWACTVLVLCSAFGRGHDGPRLSLERLQPHGGFAHPSSSPVRFTFAPIIGKRRGVVMQGFWLHVSRRGHEVFNRTFTTQLPVAEVQLLPGRYQWQVQWFSTDGEVSDPASSDVVVADSGGDVWTGIPWMGANDTNEYEAQFDLSGSQSDQVELLVTTLGFGYVQINGQDVSQDILSYAGWTRTDRRVLYRNYEVTKLLNSTAGGHLFVALGCGYRCDPKGRFPSYKDPAEGSQDTVPKVFRLQMRINGRLAFHTGTPGAWRRRQGPVTQDSVYDGEVYNPRAVGPWVPSESLPVTHGPPGAMVAASFPGVQVTRVDHPISITAPAPGVHVVDFGSNVAGVCQISVPQAATVMLKHGEVLQHTAMPLKKIDPSRVYFDNLRSAAANDTLILDGPIQNWRPRFTYHGFRYVEVYGFPGQLTAEFIERLVMNTALPDRVNVTLSDEVLQAIHMGSKGVQRSNLMQVPTDCPQRDERLGWMGDASLSAASLLAHWDYNHMVSAFLDSMVDEMGTDGSLPDVVPFQRFGGRPADLSWSAAFLENLWQLWQKDGDLKPAQKHWDSVKAHVSSLNATYTAAGNVTKLPQSYGDWCPPPRTPGGQATETPPAGFTSAVSMLRSVQQAADLGTALGGAAAKDVESMITWHKNMLGAFHEGYYNPVNKTYANGVMATYVLPLAIGAVPATELQAVSQGLLKYIADHGNTWTGGIITVRFLFDVLHDVGAAATALSMLQKKDYPSYGYMYFNAYEPANESMWEVPDAPNRGPGMNSRAHHMYSSVGHYLTARVAGISVSRGHHVEMVVGQLSQVNASVATDFGAVQFSWSRQPSLTVEVTVPVGILAYLFVPVADGTMRLRSFDGQPFGEGLHSVVAGSGKYRRFTVPSGAHTMAVEREAVSGEFIV